MSRLRLRPSTAPASLFHAFRPPLRRWHATKTSDPLGILFFGSDNFSCASLQALHEESIRNPALVKSIDVGVRSSKRTGRGRKTVRDPPLKGLAGRLGLRVHETEDLEGWQMPPHVNLIVAVSFGKFLTEDILRKAKYGGVNVHPSLLPDLRGAAPIHHAILQGRTHTGVSLQTLDTKRFDHGVVLAQTPSPGLPIPAGATTPYLQTLLAPLGASMLVDGLRAALHVPPYRDVAQTPTMPVKLARKVGKHSQQVQWAEWSATDLDRRVRALGRLWCSALHRSGALRRLILEEFEVVPAPERVASYLARFNADPDGTEDGEGVHRVVWMCQKTPSAKNKKTDDEVGDAKESFRQVELPYFEDEEGDGTSVLVPAVGGGGCLRIRSIRADGEKTRPARLVLEGFKRQERRELDWADVAFEVVATPVRFFVEDLRL